MNTRATDPQTISPVKTTAGLHELCCRDLSRHEAAALCRSLAAAVAEPSINIREMVRESHVRLSVDEAREVCRSLRLLAERQGMGHFCIEPFDLPGTVGVWHSQAPDGRYYRHVAARSLIERLAHGRTAERLARLTAPSKISDGTVALFDGVLAGRPLAEEGMRRAAVCRLVAGAANGFSWDGREGAALRRAACREFGELCEIEAVQQLLQRERCDPFTVDGFRQILPRLTVATFRTYPINSWGTTLSGLIQCGRYEDDALVQSPRQLVLELLAHDEDFSVVRGAGLAAYDFPKAPNHLWTDQEFRPTPLCAAVSALLVEALAAREGIAEAHSRKAAEHLLPKLTSKAFHTVPINVWGTTLGGMLMCAYQDSAPLALKDMVGRLERFAAWGPWFETFNAEVEGEESHTERAAKGSCDAAAAKASTS